jgi:hypothetical protein
MAQTADGKKALSQRHAGTPAKTAAFADLQFSAATTIATAQAGIEWPTYAPIGHQTVQATPHRRNWSAESAEIRSSHDL